MLVEPDAGVGLGHDRCERGLSDFQRITPEVIAVQFDQVKGVEEYDFVSALVTDEIERGNAVVIASDTFAVDDARARAQAGQRLDNDREAAGETVSRTAIEPHLRASLAGNDAEAVMLDFMQPLAARGQLIGFRWETRRDEAGRQGTASRACQSKMDDAGAIGAARRAVELDPDGIEAVRQLGACLARVGFSFRLPP
jgi:hypothetical protein